MNWDPIVSRFSDRQRELFQVLCIAFVKMCEKGDIDDVTAGEHTEMFSTWQPMIDYKVDDIRKYGEDLYKCLTAHTSQESWTPDASPSLWKKIGDPTVEFPEWSQPIGATDAYHLGDKVSHNGKHWISIFEGENIWEPGIYGWDEIA